MSGDAVAVTIETDEDFAKYKGTLKGKFVLQSPTREVASYFESPTRRYTEAGLDELSHDQIGAARGRFPGGPGFGAGMAFRKKRMAFYKEEGILAVVEMSAGARGDNGAVIAQGPVPGDGDRTVEGQVPVPQVVLAGEHYGRLLRVLEKKVPVKLTMNVRNRFVDTSLDVVQRHRRDPGHRQGRRGRDDWRALRLVAHGHGRDRQRREFRGDDGGDAHPADERAEAAPHHPDGALDREEQGLLGSRAYVKEHFADPVDMKLKPEHGKLSVYLNMDNGGGAFRGVYLQGNEAAAPVFEAWMKPFHNFGMQTLSIRNTGGTDHQAFDAVGLPGFQFIQDPLEYSSRTHHTNLDVYERAIPQDLMQNAIVIASFAYQAANRDALFPRKPLPKPRPATPHAGRAGPAARDATTSQP